MAEIKRKMKRAYRRTAETKEIIFETAMRLMSEKGFQGTTVREICTAAGIPVGTFYNCYKSKVDIFKRIYDAGDAFMQTEENEGGDRNPLFRLRSFALRYAKLNEKTGIQILRVLFYPSNSWFSMDRPMQNYVKQIVEDGQQRAMIRLDQTAEEIVDCMFDLLRGVCYNWCVCDGTFDLIQRTALQMKLFCSAIRTDREESSS